MSSPDRTAAVFFFKGKRDSSGGCRCPPGGHGDGGMFKDGSESLLLAVLGGGRCGVGGKDIGRVSELIVLLCASPYNDMELTRKAGKAGWRMQLGRDGKGARLRWAI